LRIGIDYTAAVKQKAGIGRYTRNLVKHLATMDRENNYVLLTVGSKISPSFPPSFRYATVPISDRLMTIIWQRLRIPLWVEIFTGHLDIFHSPDFVLPPVRKAHTILTVHDLSFLRVPHCAEPSLRAYLEKAVPRSVEQADLVLADSENTRKDLIELLGVPPDKVEVVYAGVEERFRPVDDESLIARVRRRYRLPERFILSLGTLEPRKNFVGLIKAYALAKLPLKLVIVGGKGWLYDDIFATVKESGLEEEVLFPGYVGDEDLPALYSAAELFVFPSFYEGFGLPPLEAMACGTPVVASNVSALPEVLGDAAVLVPPDDVEALAQAMKRALQDEELRQKLREAGLKRAAKFRWEKAAAKLLQIYSRFTSQI